MIKIKREGAFYVNRVEVTEEEYLKHMASKTPEEKFKAIRARIERSFEDAILSVEGVRSPKELPIKLSNHHVHDITRAINAYIDELESAYTKGEFMCMNTNIVDEERKRIE